MAEKVLSTQLSGEEVIEAIADSVKVHLRRIGYPLRANDAFDKFSAKVSIEAQLWDVGVANPAVAVVSSGQGVAEGEADGELKTSFEIDMNQSNIDPSKPMGPNELRQATGQEIPVLTQDQEGNKITKGVKYTRKGSAIKPTAILLFLLSVMPFLSAQTPAKAPAKVEVVETLTKTEQIALQAIMAEQQKVQQDGSQFMLDVAKAHPGYHYDGKTNSLAKDEPVKPEPKK